MLDVVAALWDVREHQADLLVYLKCCIPSPLRCGFVYPSQTVLASQYDMKLKVLPEGTEDAGKILNSDGACPICDQVLSKSLMKPVDINPNDEWNNVSITELYFGPPRYTSFALLYTSYKYAPDPCLLQLVDGDGWRISSNMYPYLMKSAYRSVMFYIGQKELEMQCKMNRIVAQYRQKCEAMQGKFTEKLEQVHTAYQKMAKRCQMMEQEIENLSRDKQELQEKFAEKSRQKRKLDEMYDQLRSEYESQKRSAIQPLNNFYPRPEPDLFSNPSSMMDTRDPLRTVDLAVADWSVFNPTTPGSKEDIWPARQNTSKSGPFDISGGSPAKPRRMAVDAGNRTGGTQPTFGAGFGNPSRALRNLIFSTIKRPQLSGGPQMFT
ncbi:E3 ubiquitin-protein ligase CCNB1IP1-like protein [Drosera capensis]